MSDRLSALSDDDEAVYSHVRAEQRASCVSMQVPWAGTSSDIYREVAGGV
jgi:hypothetical protein